MKKFLSLMSILFAFALLFGTNSFSSCALEEQEAYVIVSKCYLYTAPSFTSERVTVEEEGSTILITLKHGDNVKVDSFEGDFALVSAQNHRGYIYKYYITSNTSQEVYPVFNASVRKDSALYDINQAPTDILVKKDTRVYIYEGFDDKKEFTAVQFVLENGELYNGYILTADIKPDGISGLLVIAISVILAGVTITLSILFIKKKKKNS